MSKITVIMPCLNVVQYFKECIDSVVNQTIFQDIEVLVIDAGSIDGTYEIAEFYAAKYENVRVIISEKRSYGYQVNLGIKEAKSPYVAILETDDYAREDMYERLYHVAEEQQVDYIKADYDMFYVCRNGAKVFKRMIISKNEADYNTILDTTKNAHMHIQDFSVWKGIYRRDFLLENHIFFNESPGAAYQDIGFGQILHSHATRAYYISDSLYRYRVGRAGASVNSGRGIVYARNEFARLLDTQSDLQGEHELFLPGVYESMLSSFLGEFGLLEAATAVEDASILDSARWIGEQVENAIVRGIISEESIRTDLGEGRLERFRKIQSDIPGAIAELVRTKREQKEQWSRLSHIENPIYIFGAGNYGMYALRLLDSLDISIRGFLDNAAEDGKQIAGYDVMLPTSQVVEEHAKVIIANKYHADEIRGQLLDIGVEEDNIMEYKNS